MACQSPNFARLDIEARHRLPSDDPITTIHQSPTAATTTHLGQDISVCVLAAADMSKAKAGVDQIVKLIVGAGQASPSPPVGPALGSKGVKSMDFCKVSRTWQVYKEASC